LRLTYLRCSVRRAGRSFSFPVGRAELRLGELVVPVSPLCGARQRDGVALDPALHCPDLVLSGSKGQHALNLIPWLHPALRQGHLALPVFLASMPRHGSRSPQAPRAFDPHDDKPVQCAPPPRPARLSNGVILCGARGGIGPAFHAVGYGNRAPRALERRCSKSPLANGRRASTAPDRVPVSCTSSATAGGVTWPSISFGRTMPWRA
jgi:hypothetical protein